MQIKTFSYHNSHISYRGTGNGKPVLLIHGFAEDSRIWDGILKELAQHNRLIIPDIPGSGPSTLLQGDNITISDYADLMMAILEKENVEKTSIIGHSMGGYISLAFAKKYPGKINALGLFHSSAYADDEAKKQTRQKAINVIQEKGSMAFLKTAIPGLFADAEKSSADIDLLLEQAKDFRPEALIQYYEAMISRPDTTKVLQELKEPVLMIMGEHDKAVPFVHGLRQSHLPQLSHIHILRNSAHMGMLEEKERTISILSHFLRAVYVY